MISIKGRGIVVLWNALECDHSIIASGFESIGLKGFIPNPRTKLASLLHALKQVYCGQTWLIRPLKGKNGYQVVKETKGLEANDLEHERSFIMFDDESMTVSPFDQTLVDRVSQEYKKASGRVSPIELTDCLRRMLTSPHSGFNGIPLKDAGAVYWVSEDMKSMLDSVGNAISAATANEFRFSIFRHELNDEERASVLSAAIQDLNRKCGLVYEDVSSGELKGYALANRERECESLIRKAEFFQTALQTDLSQIIKALDDVKVAASTAAILAGSSN
jgi:hypothetical protein